MRDIVVTVLLYTKHQDTRVFIITTLINRFFPSAHDTGDAAAYVCANTALSFVMFFFKSPLNTSLWSTRGQSYLQLNSTAERSEQCDDKTASRSQQGRTPTRRDDDEKDAGSSVFCFLGTFTYINYDSCIERKVWINNTEEILQTY